MKFYYDAQDNKYILTDTKLDQGLKVVFSKDTVYVVDPDVKKNWEGKEYPDKLEVTGKEDGKVMTVGIVQKLKREDIQMMLEMFDIVDLSE